MNNISDASKATAQFVTADLDLPEELRGSVDLTAAEDIPNSLRGRIATMSADLETLKMDGQLKAARFRHFEFFCDEPPSVRGDDAYPQPLTYMVAGIGFCLLTQIQRTAFMTKKSITRAECRIEYDFLFDGSVLADTIESRACEVRIHVRVESPEPPEVVARVLRLAERSCPAEALVRQPVSIRHRYEVNGAEMIIDPSVRAQDDQDAG
jgi:uncharacterized OsmC-like protein